MLSPAQRKARATLGAYELHAQGKTNTGPARAAFRNRFLEAQPANLPQAERERRAEMARKAYYVRLNLASLASMAKARATRRNTKPEAAPSTPAASGSDSLREVIAGNGGSASPK